MTTTQYFQNTPMDNRMRHTQPQNSHRINELEPLLLGFIWFLLNNCMNKTAERIEHKWLTDNGINTKTFITDPLYLVQAQQIAYNLLKHHSQLLEKNQAASLNNFLKAVGNGKERQRIKQRDAERVMNIGAQINRKLFKKIRHSRQGKL